MCMQVHGDYSEDVGTKLERPADEPVAEGVTEVIGAWIINFVIPLCYFLLFLLMNDLNR